MHRDYMTMFMEKLDLPPEAQKTFLSLDGMIASHPKERAELCELSGRFLAAPNTLGEILGRLDILAGELDIHPYTLHFYFLMGSTEGLQKKYKEAGLPESLFWHTIADLRYKLLECKDVYGLWGTFVAGWYPGFFDMTRFALGRLQFEWAGFPLERYENHGVSLHKGDRVLNMHIPSCGPLTKEARMDAYRQAYRFFDRETAGAPLPMMCESWLLYPGHRDFLPAGSNILDFLNDFDILEKRDMDKENFGDLWRIFGRDYTLPAGELPTDTTLRQVYRDRLLSGKPVGLALGVLVFDGKEILAC